jgi:hypothetical protein
MNLVHMKILFYSLLIIVFFSCSKISPSNNTITCSFSITTTKPLSKNQSVQYTAGITGTGGTFSSITYLDSAGMTTVQNPTIPFIQHVNLKANVFPTMSAKGTANLGGQLLIYIDADSIQSGNGCNN